MKKSGIISKFEKFLTTISNSEKSEPVSEIEKYCKVAEEYRSAGQLHESIKA